jgi:hypothetical protein
MPQNIAVESLHAYHSVVPLTRLVSRRAASFKHCCAVLVNASRVVVHFILYKLCQSCPMCFRHSANDRHRWSLSEEHLECQTAILHTLTFDLTLLTCETHNAAWITLLQGNACILQMPGCWSGLEWFLIRFLRATVSCNSHHTRVSC